MERGTQNHFQTVLLQRAQLFTGAKYICTHIATQLALWNKSEFDELVTDSHAAATSYLTRVHEHNNMEQRHQTFSNLVLNGNFCEAVRFTAGGTCR